MEIIIRIQIVHLMLLADLEADGKKAFLVCFAHPSECVCVFVRVSSMMMGSRSKSKRSELMICRIFTFCNFMGASRACLVKEMMRSTARLAISDLAGFVSLHIPSLTPADLVEPHLEGSSSSTCQMSRSSYLTLLGRQEISMCKSTKQQNPFEPNSYVGSL